LEKIGRRFTGFNLNIDIITVRWSISRRGAGGTNLDMRRGYPNIINKGEDA
jgi:hypothetical protein